MSRTDHIVNRRQETTKKPVRVAFGTSEARQVTRAHRQGSKWWRQRFAEVVELRKTGRTRDQKIHAKPPMRPIAAEPKREDFDSRQTYRAACRAYVKYVGKMERLQGVQGV